MLQEHCANTVYLDSRELILTDNAFTNAEPLYGESCARIRVAVQSAALGNLVVLGGSIGSTEDGRTTTLGRGGSDLTASIVGAAISAEQIQNWKYLNRVFTWDPRTGQRASQISRRPQSFLGAANLVHPN